MTKSHFPSDKRIIDYLDANYSLQALSLTPLSGGADRKAAIYKIQASDHSYYFVKVRLGHESNVQTTLLELLCEAGINQVIPPVKTTHGASILQIDHGSITVYPFIEGVNGFSHKLTDQQWITLGKVLKKVHEFAVPSSLINHIRKETYSSKWRNAVRSLYDHIEKKPPPSDAISLKFFNFLHDHRLVIQRLVTRAEELSHDIKKQPANFVLCHSDIHGGNVLLKGSSTLYIVDWDDPIMAPKERDLMFIGGGVANVWNDPQEEIAFYKGYGDPDIDTTLLAYYRHERIVEDIAEYGQALLLTKPDPDCNNRLEMYNQFVSMFSPHGVVDIAFNTEH